MKLHEYQAKQLLAKYNVPVPENYVAATGPEASAATEKLGGKSVVKAQVHAGGRGKAGGVKIANNPIAESCAGALLALSTVATTMALLTYLCVTS